MFSVRVSVPLTAADSPGKPLLFLQDEIDANGSSFTTQVPGGFGTAIVKFRRAIRATAIPALAHVEIFGAGAGSVQGLAWEGRLVRPIYVGRNISQFEAQGYAITAGADDVVTATASANEQKFRSSLCLERALAASSSLFSIGTPWGVAVGSHAMSEFNGRGAFDVATQLSALTGFDFAVWEGRKAAWALRTPPLAADYLIPEDQCPQWEPDYGGIWTAVTVTYTDITSNVAASFYWSDPVAVKALGIARHTTIPGGKISKSSAADLAQTYVSQHSVPSVRAQIGPLASVRTPSGAAVPGYAVRAMQWLQVQNRSAAMIVQTSCDWKGSVTAQIGQPALDGDGTLAFHAQQVYAFRHGINPNSGGLA